MESGSGLPTEKTDVFGIHGIVAKRVQPVAVSLGRASEAGQRFASLIEPWDSSEPP